MTTLQVQTKGISQENNRAIYGYLKKLRDRGEISAVLMKLIIDSFAGIELPVVSQAKVTRIAPSPFSPDEVYLAVGAAENRGLFFSVVAIKTLTKLKYPDIDPTDVRKYHASVVRFFL